MRERQKRQTLLIWLKNILSLCSIFTIGAVLIFIIQGWTINSNGEPIRTGLVQFATNISGSVVEVGDKTLSERTNTKTQLAPGEYEFKMWSEGYETWYRKTSVAASEVLWLNYARLVPKEKKTETFLQLEDLKAIKFAKNGQKALAITENADKIAHFWLIELADSPRITEVSFPENLFNRKLEENETYLQNVAENLSIDELNEDATRAILKWQNGENANWLAVNLSNTAESRNLTSDFSVNISKIVARDKNHNSFFALTDGELREISLGNSTISANLLNNLVDFEKYNENILAFVQKNDQGKFTAGIFERGRSDTALIAQNLNSQPKIAIGRYYSENYLHVLNGETLQIYKGDSWIGGNQPRIYKTLTLDFVAEGFSLNEEMRFLKISSSEKTQIYDLETNSKYVLNGGGFAWLDNFILYNFQNHQLMMRDFDGSNVQGIFEIEPEFGAKLSNNERYIYGISKNESGIFELKRVRMRI
ncbi:MAG: PEGA domain-containing protein [bacterium]|nr:PEGA domain-containing protein [bacterium]